MHGKILGPLNTTLKFVSGWSPVSLPKWRKCRRSMESWKLSRLMPLPKTLLPRGLDSNFLKHSPIHNKLFWKMILMWGQAYPKIFFTSSPSWQRWTWHWTILSSDPGLVFNFQNLHVKIIYMIYGGNHCFGLFWPILPSLSFSLQVAQVFSWH